MQKHHLVCAHACRSLTGTQLQAACRADWFHAAAVLQQHAINGLTSGFTRESLSHVAAVVLFLCRRNQDMHTHARGSQAGMLSISAALQDAAILLARAAQAAGVPVLEEGERLRPGLHCRICRRRLTML
jgi:hypothetical protein